MPYIAMNTAQTLTPAQKEQVKSEFGRLIAIIPGKSEAALMIDFADGHTMYFRGEPKDSCAFIEIRLYGRTELEAKSKLTEEVVAMLGRVLGIATGDIFLNIVECLEWGSGGVYKTLQ